MGASQHTTGIVYLLLMVAFMALILFSNNSPHPRPSSHRRFMHGKRIKLRTPSVDQSKRHDPVAFDPVVAEYERRREDRAWEKHYFEQKYKEWGEVHKTEEHHEDPSQHQAHAEVKTSSAKSDAEHQPEPWENNPDYEDPEDYLNDEDQFNITNRLTVLFPLLDTNPHDGFVSVTELQDWHMLQGHKGIQHRTDREMEVHDKNHDGLVTFEEYLPNLTKEELEKNSMDHGGAAWYRAQFAACDGDKDGALNRTEFNDFLHPEDSKNPSVQKWMRQELIRLRDKNSDGKLDWEEFHSGAYEQIRDHSSEELQSGYSHIQPSADDEAKKQVQSKEMFATLDLNKDGLLTEDEIIPIVNKIQPGELYYAKEQAKYLLEEADDNKDGKLTVHEMLEHPYVFYSTAFDHESNEAYDYNHDEFR